MQIAVQVREIIVGASSGRGEFAAAKAVAGIYLGTIH